MKIRHTTALGLALYAAFLTIAALLSPAVRAADLPRPSGPIVLTVSGAISVTNAPGKAEFDQAMLAALGAEKLKTSTSWTDGQPEFEGVRVSKLLDALGAHGTTLGATAIDDYTDNIPMDLLTRYPVLLAWSMNGTPLKPQDKGPFWIVFPRDDYPELRDAKIDFHSVWQLVSMTIK